MCKPLLALLLTLSCAVTPAWAGGLRGIANRVMNSVGCFGGSYGCNGYDYDGFYGNYGCQGYPYYGCQAYNYGSYGCQSYTYGSYGNNYSYGSYGAYGCQGRPVSYGCVGGRTVWFNGSRPYMIQERVIAQERVIQAPPTTTQTPVRTVSEPVREQVTKERGQNGPVEKGQAKGQGKTIENSQGQAVQNGQVRPAATESPASTEISADSTEVEQIGPPEKKDSPATLIVRMPAEAKLKINGVATRLSSERRTFVTPPLKSGEVFHYQLQAEVVRNGETLSSSQRVALRSGEKKEVQLDLAGKGGE